MTRKRVQKALILLATLFLGALLAARAYFGAQTPRQGWIFWARCCYPIALALVVAVLTAASMLARDASNQDIATARKIYPGVLTAISAVAIGILDLLIGVPQFPPLVGMVILALLYWSRPRLLAILVLAVAMGIGAAMIALSTPFFVEYATTLVISPVIAIAASLVLRKSVLPSEEKLHFLEEENKELWNLSYRDTLTSLFNRRYMQQTAVHIFQRAVRYGEPLHILMMDIDHFKRVNDKLGHAVGDEVLKKVAAAIQSFVRTSDTVARYGGEEFIAFIVQSNDELTQFVANRIRDGIAALQIDDVPWSVTLSIGVASLQEGDTIDSLISRADQYLYMSKQTGRNRVSGS